MFPVIDSLCIGDVDGPLTRTMALPLYRKVVFEDALDRLPRGSKAHKAHPLMKWTKLVAQLQEAQVAWISSSLLKAGYQLGEWYPCSPQQDFHSNYPWRRSSLTIMLWWRIKKLKSSHILNKNNLAYRTFELRRRRNPGVLESNKAAVETLLINTPCKDPTAWKVALIECANLDYVGGYRPKEIDVEILNTREFHCNISQVLEDNPEVLEVLHQIRLAIFEEVRRLCLNWWSSIAFHSKSRLCTLQGEAMPTVLVFVWEGFRAYFSKLEYQLLQLRNSLRVSIKLEILNGSIIATWNIYKKPITY